MQITVKKKKKRTRNFKKSQLKLENLFAEAKLELKAVNSKVDNSEEGISDLEYRTHQVLYIGTFKLWSFKDVNVHYQWRPAGIGSSGQEHRQEEEVTEELKKFAMQEMARGFYFLREHY